MTTYKAVQIDSPAASELAELHGIRTDLQQVRWICDRILELGAQPTPPDPVVLEALSNSAVIRYCRCFASGVRPAIHPPVSARFSQQQQQLHDYLTAYRSKFVAHSVNPYEDNRTTVSVPEVPPDGWQPTGLGFFHARQATLGAQLVEELRQLATWVDAQVQELMKPLETTVLDEVRALPAKQLAGRDLISPSLPTPSDVTRRRS